MKSHQWSRRLLLASLALIVICVHLSDGSSISREIPKSEKSVTSRREEKSSDNDIKPHRKKSSQYQKKYNNNKQSPIFSSTEFKKSPSKNKLKISDLRPCISKAFCEVNSITEEPTYETSTEFYMILNRLKKFIDDGEKADLNGSGSAEDDYSGSSEESYERIPYMHDNYNGPQRSGSPPYYRRGKSLAEVEAKLKKKKIKKLVNTNKIKNGTQTSGNATFAKVYSPAQIEQRSFVDRKTQELNVVDDLAALIKISAEIGQALRSPRKCRSLFKKCRMTYEQIIRIFNRTQSVETSDSDFAGFNSLTRSTTTTSTTPEPFLVVETSQTLTELPGTAAAADSSPPSSSSDTTTKQTQADLQEEAENVSDGIRNKKSRTDFTDDEDPEEYVTDFSEVESQPVKTYSLFSNSQSDTSSLSPGGGVGGSKRQETIVDEAFHKFEKVFPASGAADKPTKLYQNQKGSISSKLRPVVASSSEEEEEEDENYGAGSNESGEANRTKRRQRPSSGQSDYNHRSSAENNNNQDSEEVEMEVPDKKVKTKHNTRPVKENAEIAGEVDEAEDDSDAEIASSEIGNKKEDEEPVPNKKTPVASSPSATGIEADSSESDEEESSGEEAVKNNDKEQGSSDLIYTRDDDKSGGFNTYGFYPQVRPSLSTKHVTKSVKSKGKKRKGNKKAPHDDQNNSSEEDLRNKDLPESDFEHSLKQVDDDGPKRGSKKAKRRPPPGGNDEYGDYGDYPNRRRPGQYHDGGNKPTVSGGGYEVGSNYGPYGSEGEGPPPQSDDPQQSNGGGGGFFQSIMGWFSRGNKPAQSNNEQTGYYPSDGGGNNKRPGYGGEEEYPPQPPYNNNRSPPQKSYSGEYDDYGAGPSAGGRRRKPPTDLDREDDRYPSSSSQGKPGRGSRYPPPGPPQGRRDESSEEEEEDEEDDEVRPIKRQIQNNRRPKNPQSQQSSGSNNPQYLGGSGLLVSGPPPPLVIEPSGGGNEDDHHQAGEYSNPRHPVSTNNQPPKQKQQPQKQKPERVENSEEISKEENSSEEEKSTPKHSQSSSSKKKHSLNPKKNANANKKNGEESDKVFSGMFASAAEIDKQILRDKDDDDREDGGLLLSTFDSVANTFSTSADKIRDWSAEDKSRKKINVGLFATNTRGKYTVKKNKNRGQQGSSFEVEEKNGNKGNNNNSSEEEEEDKK